MLTPLEYEKCGGKGLRVQDLTERRRCGYGRRSTPGAGKSPPEAGVQQRRAQASHRHKNDRSLKNADHLWPRP